MIEVLASNYVFLMMLNPRTPSDGPSSAYLLSIGIEACPNSISTDQSCTVMITVSSGGVPISGANVTLACNGGSLNATSDVTDFQGKLTASFSSAVPGTFAITASACTSGYQPVVNVTQVSVGVSVNQTSRLGQEFSNATEGGCRGACTTGGSHEVVDTGVSSAEGGSCASALDENLPLFRVEGLVKSAYLRTSVGEVYRSGFWFPSSPSGDSYHGEILFTPPLWSEPLCFKVVPLASLGGFLPVMRETVQVDASHVLDHFPLAMSFQLDGVTSNAYSVVYVPEAHDMDLLALARCPHDEIMIDLPPSVTNRTRQLANNITTGIVGDYKRAVAIRDFLGANYKYNKNYTRAPLGVDPVEWFLFESKEGVCANFNSAFVILCRCVGIPSRVVRGYLVNPMLMNQTVKQCQSHCWAEVEFTEVGWVTFDATGRATGRGIDFAGQPYHEVERKETVTVITSQLTSALRGDKLTVSGRVTTLDGAGVSGVKVLVQMTTQKNATGLCIGFATTEGGSFEAICQVPEDHAIGQFLVVAQAVGNQFYVGSISDPPIKIMSRSSVIVRCPDTVSVGETFSMSATLLENETSSPIPQATLNVEIKNVRSLTGGTDTNGTCVLSMAIGDPGNYSVQVSYGGDTFRLPCEASTAIEVVLVRLDWVCNATLVRNEPWRTYVKVIGGGRGIGNVEVSLELDGGRIATGRTDSSGVATLDYSVPRDISLGLHDTCTTVPTYGLRSPKPVTVYARTKLDLKYPSTVEAGEWYLLNASLLDDLGQPMANQTLVISASSKEGARRLEFRTDERGFLSANFTAPQEQGADFIEIEAKFVGSLHYLSSAATGLIIVSQPSPLSPLLVVGLGAGAIVLLYVGFLLAKKGFAIYRKPMPTDRVPKDQEQETVADLAQVPVPEEEPSERPRIYIRFPSIGDVFPLVWGVADPLEVLLICRGPIPERSQLNVKTGDKDLLSKECEREQRLTVSFPVKGVYSIAAGITSHGMEISSAEAKVRIVEYREEINSMHKTVANDIKNTGVPLQDTMTLREESATILDGLKTLSDKDVSRLYSAFEKVDYTLKPVARSDYEMAYLSLLSVRNDLLGRR